MAKKLLLDVLVNTLGQYVEGLSPENMRLGVWSGKIEMSNLKMKSTALEQLNLPITISHGSLKYLKLKIPWTQLESKPVRVVIDGVYLQCGPLDVASLTVEDLRQRVLAGKRERLKAAMEAIISSNTGNSAADVNVNETAKQATYIQQLTTKILGNIEITLTNVHIRYEDSTTVPGKTFSTGVTIESISLVTTDDRWVETFVDQVKQLDESIHKLGRMVNLGIYWSSHESQKLQHLNAEEWEKAMQARIYSESHAAPKDGPVGAATPSASSNSPRKPPLSPHNSLIPLTPGARAANTQDIQYLLALPNNMSVMITHTKAPKENVPKLDVQVETAHLAFTLDSAQYKQIILTSTRFGTLDRQKQMALYRPSQRPDKDPRAWWHYAYRLVTGTELSFAKKLDTMLLCLKKKDRYISLLKQSQSAEGETLSRLDAEISQIEEQLPLASLFVFRQIAGIQIKQDNDAALKARKASGKDSSGGMSGYIGGMFGWGAKKADEKDKGAADKNAKGKRGSSLIEDDDDALMERIQQTLRLAESHAVDQFAIRINVASSARLDITTNLEPLLTAQLALAASAEVHAKNTRLTFSLSRVSLEDRFTVRPLSKYIVIARRDLTDSSSESTKLAGKSSLELTPTRSTGASSSSKSGKDNAGAGQNQAAFVGIDMKEGIIAITISSLPMEITWNHSCIQQLLQFFAAQSNEPEQSFAVVSSPLLVGSMNKFNMEAFLPAASTVEVHLEIHAPKIVVPEDASDDRGCLLLDSGYLVISGQISDVGMRWDISLSAVNVGMPLSVADRYKQASDGSVYLVKPFDIRTLVQNFDTSVADLTVDVRVAPSISTELDAAKINRLVKTINAVMLSIQMPDSKHSLDAEGVPAAFMSGVGLGVEQIYLDVPQSQSSQSQKSKVSPDRKQLALQVQLPAITVDLAITPIHVVVLAITTLDMNMVQRPHDTELIFRLNSLSLQDPMRHSSQQFIIKTATSSRHTHLIQFLYRAFTSPEAPLFSGFGTEYQMDFAQMALNIDPAVVLRLKPLLEALKDLGKDPAPSLLSLAHTDSPDSDIPAGRRSPQLIVPLSVPLQGPSIAQPTPPSTAVSTGPPGIKLRIAVDKISVDLMRSRKTNVKKRSSEKDGPGSPRDKTNSPLRQGPRVSAKILREPEIDALTGLEILEVAYSLDMNGLAAAITTLNQTEVKLYLQSFDVMDKRAVSQSYIYKSLLCRSDVASEHSSMYNSKTDATRDRKDSHEAGTRGRSASVVEGVSSTFSISENGVGSAGAAFDAQQQQSIFYLLYKEETTSRTMLEVALKDVTSFIAVDSFVDLVSVAMENADAVMDLLESLNPSTIEMAAAAAARAAAAAAVAAQKIRSGSVYVGDNAGPVRGRHRSGSVVHTTREKRKFRRSGKDPLTSLGAIPEDDENLGEKSPVKGPAGGSVSGSAEKSREEDQSAEFELHNSSPSSASSAPVASSDAFTFNVVVSVVNPRLIFLEDPENPDSRAIVGRCGITLHYCNDIKNRTTQEVKEMIHVSLNTAEVFVLTGMQQGFPQQIIEPTGLELHLNRAVEMGVELAVSVSLDMESISGRVSFNDLALGKAILARAGLAVESVSKPGRARGNSMSQSSDDGTGDTSSNQSSGVVRSRSNTLISARPRNLSLDDVGLALDKPEMEKVDIGSNNTKKGSDRKARQAPAPIVHLTMYDVSLHVGKVSVVIIDDSDAKNLPIAKLMIDRVAFQAQGASIQVTGAGSMVLQCEHYNTNVACWEPIVEHWSPSVTFLYDAMTTSVEVATDDLVFVNVSGAMTKSIARAVSLFSLLSSDSITPHDRQKFHPFEIHNELGVPLDIFDSTTTRKLVSLDMSEAKALPPSNKDHTSSQRSVHRMDVFSSTVDLRLTGPMVNQRMPLFQVPLNINRVRPFYLQPVDSANPSTSGGSNGGSGPGGASASTGGQRLVTGGPIVEETYENERYDLAKGWSGPWTSLGDPPHWSDALGQTRRDRIHINLPSDRWEWADERWSVDVSGVVGKEIDEGGWEYATNFGAFSISKQRRAKQPLDSVRRRRWVRTRVLKPTLTDTSDSTRPLTLFWDVRARPNGSRVVKVRSGLQVKNCMPFAIELAISLNAAEKTSEVPTKGWKNHSHVPSSDILGPILEGQVLSVPLLLTHAHTIRIRPHAPLFPNPSPMDLPPLYEWSETIDCRLKALDKQAAVVLRKALQCAAKRRAVPQDGDPDEQFAYASQPLCMRAEYKQDSDSSRLITINPLAVLVNLLPSAIAYRCKSTSSNIERVSSTASKVTKTGQAEEQGLLSAGGGSVKLVHVDLSRPTALVSLKLGNFKWSLPSGVLPNLSAGGAGSLGGSAGPVSGSTTLAALVGKEHTMLVDLQHPEGSDQGGQITVSITVSAEHVVFVSLYSRQALVDMSGLQMSVKCLRLTNAHSETREIDAPESTEANINALLDEHVISKDGLSRPMVTRRAYALSQSQGQPSAELAWAHGANGLCLFQSASNKVSLGIKKGRCWVENISIVLLASGKVPFEVIEPDTKRVYLLSYTVSPMAGIFRTTQQVTVMPSYVVVNCMDEPLEIKQVGTSNTSQSLIIAAGGSAGWHITDRNVGRSDANGGSSNNANTASNAHSGNSNNASAGSNSSSSSGSNAKAVTSTSVHIRTESSTWSLGSIDVNDIGTSIIILPCRDGYTTEESGHEGPDGYSYSGGNSHRMLLAHVEVKFAEPQENAYITIVIWRQTIGSKDTTASTKPDANPPSVGEGANASPEKDAASTGLVKAKNANAVSNITADAELSVRNDTDFPITLQQAGVDFSHPTDPSYGSKFEICVPPRCWLPYGWADPSGGSMAIACVGTSLGNSSAIIEMIDMLRVGETTTLDLSHLDIPREEIVVRVVALGSGKVLHVTRQNKLTKEQLQVKRDEALLYQPRTFVFKARVAEVSLSLIAERPVRREFLSVSLFGTEGRVTFTGQNYYFRSSTSYEVKVMDLVVDNYCESAVYPVLLNSRNTGDKKKILETKQRMVERQQRERERRGGTWRDNDGGSVSGSGSSSGSLRSGSSFGGSSHGEPDEDDAEDEESSLDTNFLIFQAVTEVPLYASTLIFRRIALRMLELEVTLDSSTLQLYLCDLHNDLIGGTSSSSSSSTGAGSDDWSANITSNSNANVLGADTAGQSAAAGQQMLVLLVKQQREWVAVFNQKMLQDAAAPLTSTLVPAQPAKETAQRYKIYFEQFVMHPIKLRLSFVPTPFPTSRDPRDDILTGPAFRHVRLFKGFSYINELVVKMNSFIFSNAMESAGSLGARVAGKVTEDLKRHLVQIAGRLVGSIGIIGRPAGVYKNIGSGVQDFFYEPYQGLMHSPKGFAIGAARGTRKLFAGFASGLVGSTASIVGSASKGVAKGSSLFAGDREYALKRDEKRRQLHAAGGGVKAGAKAAGESVLQGFASGLSGLVKKPFEEGRKTGALGFMKGVGMGLAGALAKPVVGITDGIGAFSQGVTNRMNSVEPVEATRPPRAFERSPSDYSALILVPWDPQAAVAQTVVRARAARDESTDDFAAFVALGLHAQRKGSWTDNSATSNTLAIASASATSSADRSLGASGCVILSNEVVFRLSELDLREFNRDGTRKTHANGSSGGSNISDRDVTPLGVIAWIYPYTNISHVALARDSSGSYRVELVVYSRKSLHVREGLVAQAEAAMRGGSINSNNSNFGGGNNVEVLACGSREIAIRLYTQLSQRAAKMGNPSSVLPVDIAIKALDPAANATASFNSGSGDAGDGSGRGSGSSSVSDSRGRGWRGKPKEQLINPNLGGAVTVGEEGVAVREWQYQFGSANRTPFPQGTWPEREVLRRASMRLLLPLHRVPLQRPRSSGPADTDGSGGPDGSGADNHDDGDDEANANSGTPDEIHREVDLRVWQLVSEWTCTHNVFNISRCLVLVLLNHSPNPVQIQRLEMAEGKNVMVLGAGPGSGYDAEARTLLGRGGIAVIFAHAFRPSLLDLAHVKILLQTSACEAQASTRANLTECQAVGGFECGFLEKSLGDTWAKFVLLIK